MVHALNSSTWEVEVGGSLGVSGQPGLQSEFQDSQPGLPCLRKKNKKRKNLGLLICLLKTEHHPVQQAVPDITMSPIWSQTHDALPASDSWELRLQGWDIMPSLNCVDLYNEIIMGIYLFWLLGVVVHTFNPSTLRGRSRRISASFRSQPGLQSEFQASQDCTVKTCK